WQIATAHRRIAPQAQPCRARLGARTRCTQTINRTPAAAKLPSVIGNAGFADRWIASLNVSATDSCGWSSPSSIVNILPGFFVGGESKALPYYCHRVGDRYATETLRFPLCLDP